MKVFVFRNNNSTSRGRFSQESISAVLKKVAETTDTSDLVVAIYIVHRSTSWVGRYMRDWLGPTAFYAGSGREQASVRSFEVPVNLPKQFKLIRMVFGTSARYPRTDTDRYGWKMRFASYDDHLALLFAHELHHYRRYHLGLHSGEGEQFACKWALERARKTGFAVEGARILRRRKATKKTRRVPSTQNPESVRRLRLRLSRLCPADLGEVSEWINQRLIDLERHMQQEKQERHYEKLRALPDGAPVRIVRGSNHKHANQIAVKVRTLRRNSRRLEIQTVDGKVWGWPMRWLEEG